MTNPLLNFKTAKEILNFLENTNLSYKEAGLTKERWSGYMKIKNSRYLYSKSVQSFLPSTVSSLYELSLLGEERFNQALKEGIVTPSVSAKKIKNWRLSYNEIDKDYKLKNYVLVLHSDSDAEQIESEIKDVVSKYGKVLSFENKIPKYTDVVQEIKVLRLEEAEKMVVNNGWDKKALSLGHTIVYSRDRQRRYYSRQRLTELAEKGNHVAAFLSSHL